MRLMGRVARGEGARACRCSSNVLTSSTADSMKTKDSMMGAASTPSEAEKGEKVDVETRQSTAPQSLDRRDANPK